MRLELIMKIPEIKEQEGLVNYAERMSQLYYKSYNTETRKLKGQFFTPKQISTFMAGLFNINNTCIRLLDAGAGTGILTAAFCDQLLKCDIKVRLTIDVYENDPNILPFLKMTLESCKIELENKGHNVEFNIYEQDYILQNINYFTKSDLSSTGEKRLLYDFIISNPPYYKLNGDSPQSIAMKEIISGQPNIYAFFMALSACMLKSNGELVYITPRSFCSGLYYKKFRKWLLNNLQITNIHIFESRKGIFENDNILQENIILKLKKSEQQGEIIISETKNGHFDNLNKFHVLPEDVIFRKNGDIFIRIPASYQDIETLHIVDSWPCTLKDMGVEISTGPVVSFRADDYLLPELTKSPESVPLLWMHNMKDMKVVWPFYKIKKPSAIQVCKETKPVLLPVKNYVLVKRFSSKEQKRRLYASVLLESDIPFKNIGIENHVNYIHRPKGNLSVQETFGIASILNTNLIDNFFRTLNGNTQVNATEIRSLPFPDIEKIKKIGDIVIKSDTYRNGMNLDNIVSGVLGLNLEYKSMRGIIKNE